MELPRQNVVVVEETLALKSIFDKLFIRFSDTQAYVAYSSNHKGLTLLKTGVFVNINIPQSYFEEMINEGNEEELFHKYNVDLRQYLSINKKVFVFNGVKYLCTMGSVDINHGLSCQWINPNSKFCSVNTDINILVTLFDTCSSVTCSGSVRIWKRDYWTIFVCENQHTTIHPQKYVLVEKSSGREIVVYHGNAAGFGGGTNHVVLDEKLKTAGSYRLYEYPNGVRGNEITRFTFTEIYHRM